MFEKTKIRISMFLSNYPKTFALAKSIYLLRAQYLEQHFQLTGSYRVNPRTSSTEAMISKLKFQSIFSEKVTTKQVITVNESYKSNNFEGLKIDICIPVYNRFDLVERLLKLIRKQADTLTRSNSFVFSIIVADDCSTDRTQNALRSLCAELGFQYLIQEKNLGVVGNVNSAFTLLDGDLFLLFNSDAQIADNTLLSMIKPILHNEKVSLVTAPNFELFSPHLRDSLSWTELAHYLEISSQDSISYVGACTAVSYAIAVRRKSIVTNYLMDPAFGKGYGEDSDLHYQVKQNGWESVWTLDTVVSHYGGASFGDGLAANSHRDFGRKLFFERWGKLYFSEIDSFEKVLDSSMKVRLSTLRDTGDERTLIITPSDKSYIGGLFLVKQLIQNFILQQKSVRLLVLDEVASKNYCDITKTVSEVQNFEEYSEIIFIGIGSVRWYAKKKNVPKGVSLKFFLQGPDWVIDPSGVNELNWMMENNVEYMVTSDTTKKLALQIRDDSKPESLVPELESTRFSGFEVFEKEYDVMFLLRSEFGKGSHLAESLIAYLSNFCKILVVSEIAFSIDSSNVDTVPRSSPTEFQKMLARSAVYVDTSLYEGFGLVARQAGLLNTKVLFYPFAGGTAELLDFPNHFRPLESPFDLLGSANLILDQIKSGSCKGCGYCEAKDDD